MISENIIAPISVLKWNRESSRSPTFKDTNFE